MPNWLASPDYYGPEAREKARGQIGRYLKRLDPDSFGPTTRTFFCFRSHAKIIMTEDLAFVGSSNFSDESRRNWECGVLVREKAALAEVAKAVGAIEGDSVRYFGPRMQEVVTPLLAARGRLVRLSARFGHRLSPDALDSFSISSMDLRKSVGESDRAWAASFDTTGPICARVDMAILDRIERTLENLEIHDYAEVTDRLMAARRGDIAVDDMRTDRDGCIPVAAFEAAIDRLERRQRRLFRRVKADVRSIRGDLDALCAQLERACGEISQSMSRIDNTREQE